MELVISEFGTCIAVEFSNIKQGLLFYMQLHTENAAPGGHDLLENATWLKERQSKFETLS